MLQSCRDNNNRAVASVFKSSACHQRPAQIYYFNVSSFFRPTFFLSFSFCFSVLAYHFQIFTTYIMVSHLLLLFTASLFVQLCLCTPPCYSAFNGGGMTYVGGPGCKPPITSQAVGSTARSTLAAGASSSSTATTQTSLLLVTATTGSHSVATFQPSRLSQFSNLPGTTEIKKDGKTTTVYPFGFVWNFVKPPGSDITPPPIPLNVLPPGPLGPPGQPAPPERSPKNSVDKPKK